jgi:DNA polymerase III delta prime subunit
MSTFYLDYQPSSWKTIELSLVEKSLVKGWIVHGLPRVVCIFGPPGTGKTSLAKLIIQSKLCLNRPPDSAEPCGKCSICEVDPAEFTQTTGVYWISPGGGFTDNTEGQSLKLAINAVLKPQQPHLFVVLEEGQNLSNLTLTELLPLGDVKNYPNVTLMVLSMNPSRIDEATREAITSRGSVINLRPPSPQDIQRFLKARLKFNPTCEDQITELIALYSSNYREALSTVATAIEVWSSPGQSREECIEELSELEIALVLHTVPLESRLMLWSYIAEGDKKSIRQLSETWFNAREKDSDLFDVCPKELSRLLLNDIDETLRWEPDITELDALAIRFFKDFESYQETESYIFNFNVLVNQVANSPLGEKVHKYLTKKLASLYEEDP